jgi:putative nucleotidyltransferase with HDIG domain
MRPNAPRHSYYSMVDVSAWATVAVTTVAAIGLALIDVNSIVPTETPLVTGAAALLVIALGFAASRHMRAVLHAGEAATELAICQGNELASRDRLAFARHAAALMTERPQDEGIDAVLTESLTRFAAHAAALVGDEVFLAVSGNTDALEAEDSVRELAARTTKAGRSITVDEPGQNGRAGVAALTAPVRLRGQTRGVIVLWRRGHAFRTDDLDGLSLVARVLELSMENTFLVSEVREQLSGTVRMMVDLVEQRLPNYRDHSQRVSRYAAAVGRQLGLDEAAVAELSTAGLLHDVGMLAVPESILNLPRRLTPEEMLEMRGHPQRGADFTRAAGFSASVQDAIRTHHERMSGDGYPAGLSGDAIPLAGRILNVCDAFVALVSDRPHRPKLPVPEAFEALRASAGTHYDAELVEAFIAVQPTVSEV